MRLLAALERQPRPLEPQGKAIAREDIGELDLTGIHWVIVGGESGPGARPMAKEWVTSILAQCQAVKVPLFFKQWGGFHKKKAGRVLDGRTWDEMPATK